MIILVLVAAVVASAPLFAAILVIHASRHEDARHSLLGRPPGRLDAVARRLLMLPAKPASVSPDDVPPGDPAGVLPPQLPGPRAARDDEDETSQSLAGPAS